MRLDNHIESAVKSVLKNPILSVLREINIAQLLNQSNFVKQSIGHSPYLVLLHFVYTKPNFIQESVALAMLVIARIENILSF